MRENLEKIFKLGYQQYRGKVLGEGAETRRNFKEFKEEIKKIVSPQDFFTEWSAGQWRWAAIPWVRVYNKQISPETGSGVYIVYLFAESGQSVFLTLNQGVSKSTITEIHQVKKDIQEKIDHKDFNVNKSRISTLVDYADSTIFYKEYKKDSLPSDEEMKEDLNSLVGIYKEYIKMKLESDRVNGTVFKDNRSKGEIKTIQSIFFGAPGTGKSHKIDNNLFKDENGTYIGKGIKEIPEGCKFRTTFHPDYDYAQFVGAYKPKKESGVITYSFVPQVFAKAYATAWKSYLSANKEDVFLVIEEINRGNCAQIFGDIFQLLDRDGEGFSQYSIDADCDFATWLREDSILKTVWSDYETKVGDGKLKLPPNLNILATMNTSDQSLFPMDSAFKRRFDWEYVPIKYAKDSDCGDDWKADEFKIVIGDSMYMWLDFLKKVNVDIDETTHSEDKQMGEFFIKPKRDDLKISFDEFRSKVLFYLWDSVYKDETERQAVFHFPYGDGDDKTKSVTFQSLFGKDAEAIVNKIMENLKVEKVTA